jgi:tyrosinase
MDAPTYTLFSNTTSMRAWNKDNPSKPVMSLESPHNFIHLAVGGFDIPAYNASPISGANGDMGENDTAALDPIFYFHHCFIDYAFWIWQRRHGCTTSLSIDDQDPGASYANNQPPAGANPGDMLTMSTSLIPFKREPGHYYTSNDCIDIEGQLGFTYGPGSLDAFASPSHPIQPIQQPQGISAAETRQIRVSGINRTKIAGSFIIAAYANVDGKRELIDAEAVLSRWNVTGCANCQTRLNAGGEFHADASLIPGDDVHVVLHTRNGPIGNVTLPPTLASAGQLHAAATQGHVPFDVEIIAIRADDDRTA